MSDNAIPIGYHAVTPYLLVRSIDDQIRFLEKAFGAIVTERIDTPMGTMHAEVKIGDSIIMMGPAGTGRPAMPVMLYLYVADADKAYERAMNAGGTSIMPPQDQYYGDRSGAVKDSNDNQWWVATRKENLSPEEMAKRAAEKHKQQACAN
jgi:PhnB protein